MIFKGKTKATRASSAFSRSNNSAAVGSMGESSHGYRKTLNIVRVPAALRVPCHSFYLISSARADTVAATGGHGKIADASDSVTKLRFAIFLNKFACVNYFVPSSTNEYPWRSMVAPILRNEIPFFVSFL